MQYLQNHHYLRKRNEHLLSVTMKLIQDLTQYLPLTLIINYYLSPNYPHPNLITINRFTNHHLLS